MGNFFGFLKPFSGSYSDRMISKYRAQLGMVNTLETSVQAMSRDQMQARTQELKEQYQSGRTLHDMLPEAFALVREAASRIIGMKHYDVQLIGGMVLNDGCIAEMKTGEGKTLVATLPAYLNALSGKNVHVITVNDYLAKHGQQWMSRVYSYLDLSTGLIVSDTEHDKRNAAYSTDIVYTTSTEVGFDYLRDNIRFHAEDMSITAHGLNYALIDEVDSILIDEARTPLIISGQTNKNPKLYLTIDSIVRKLSADDFEIEKKRNSIQLTEQGSNVAEEYMKKSQLLAPTGTLYGTNGYEMLNYMIQSLRAYHLFSRDKDYIVKDGQVLLIDEFTGRIAQGRRYSEGLHQAIEAKERVEIQSENQVLASITYQNFFRMYGKLSGMTGTAQTEASEFLDIYKLKVITVPTCKPIIRMDHDDLVFRTEHTKFDKIAEKVQECHQRGQPVLLGTASIAKSEKISQVLKHHHVPHRILNAKYHEMEAKIIAEAGRMHAVTIATNMAGRGTDILLGGCLDFQIFDAIQGCEDPEQIKNITQSIREAHEKERLNVIAVGGLLVIGSERCESRRIDNQLRGRAGRLGDPGESIFYLSLQDDLLRIFGGEKIDLLLAKFGFGNDEYINHPMLNRVIAKSQQKVENLHYEARKNVLRYDDIMNEQRKLIYQQRASIIKLDDSDKTIDILSARLLDYICDTYTDSEHATEAIKYVEEVFSEQCMQLFAKEYGQGYLHEHSLAEVKDEILAIARQIRQQKFNHHHPALVQMIKAKILISTIDECWKEHLYNMNQLREAIHLRAYAQKDPLAEYKIEAFELFQGTLEKFQEMAIFRIMHAVINPDAETDLPHHKNELIIDHNPQTPSVCDVVLPDNKNNFIANL